MSPSVGWIKLDHGGEPIEIDISDLFEDGCRIRCRTPLADRSLVDLREGGSLYYLAIGSRWRGGWADLHFMERLHAGRVGPASSESTRSSPIGPTIGRLRQRADELDISGNIRPGSAQ